MTTSQSVALQDRSLDELAEILATGWQRLEAVRLRFESQLSISENSLELSPEGLEPAAESRLSVSRG